MSARFTTSLARRAIASALVLVVALVALSGCAAASNSATIGVSSSATASPLLQSVFDTPTYTGNSYVTVNNNKPYFTSEELAEPYGTEVYGALDKLKRCTGAFAIVGPETLPTDERGDISSIKPTGWQHVEYSFVDQLSLYNRCHLIAYSLTDEDANANNLVTGTRSMNLAQNDFEQEVAYYVRDTGNHVAYRATPVFEGNNLVCSGILLEAQSIEDDGNKIQFCLYFFNVEPGVEIDYATGASKLAEQGSATYNADLESGTTASSSASSTTSSASSTQSSESVIDSSVKLTYVNDIADAQYVLNTKTGKFHTTTCENAQSISTRNRKYTTSSREDILSAGYVAGRCCNP